MSGRVRSVSAHQRRPLREGWETCSTAPGAFALPADLPDTLPWLAFRAPGTAATALLAAGLWSLDGPARRFDAEDWWFRTRFWTDACSGESVLGLDGLATIAQVWIDGVLQCSSDNMFLAHEVPIRSSGEHELVICCRAMDLALNAKKPRPRWRTPMIENQQLRWFRTTVLGRTPGWSPPAAAVGPWQEVWVEERDVFNVTDVRLQAAIHDGKGVVTVHANISAMAGRTVDHCELSLSRHGNALTSTLHWDAATGRCHGTLTVDTPDLWWPHTHGEPATYDAALLITADRSSVEVTLGPVGFRSLTIRPTDGDFEVSVNGVAVFCRGACWTPLDPIALHADRAQYEEAVEQVVAAGMNMLRVGGTMIYEDDDFLDLCDRRGILVWHEFMFANMDFPCADAAFASSVEQEIAQQLARVQARPSLAVLCGNSEVAQQAAMWGAHRDLWHADFFAKRLAELCQQACPDVLYWPSSASGGDFPHQPNKGTSSYYGVGAYLRPLTDARHSGLRFASECLAFANVPEPESIAKMRGGHSLKVHHPAWKAATPRDLGAGWDFEDVRDHYLRTLFELDPMVLRYSDHDRYLELSRIVSGEVMASSFAEWRSNGSSCRGALIWYLRDLAMGAGWGIIDAAGKPKACYYLIRRVMQPRCVTISDEGLNGLVLHVHNDLPNTLEGQIVVSAYNSESVHINQSQIALELGPHEQANVPVLSLMTEFRDLTYAYRFGPLAASLVVAELRADDGMLIADAYYFPRLSPAIATSELDLSATAEKAANGTYVVSVRSSRFAYGVHIEADGFDSSDQYFHVPPAGERSVILRARSSDNRPLRALAKAINSRTHARVSNNA